jgi:hypothetical protein
MEIHLLMMVWFTSIFFTLLAYYVRNSWVFPLIAAVSWIEAAMSLGQVTIYGFDANGNQRMVSIVMGDPNTAGMLGTYWLWWGIGIGLILMTGAWVLSSKEVGEDV